MNEERYFLRKLEDGSWVIKEEMLTKKAEERASSFVGDNRQRPKLKSAQLRKFYHELRSLAERAKDDASFMKILPLVRMLKAKVNYQKGRGLVPREFVEFIEECVDEENLRDRRDLEGFVKHFEAVVGYYYGIAERVD